MSFLHDIRYAFRSLRKDPVFAIAALLTLALGIGANSAIFSVVNGVMLRPLPFPEPERFAHLAWDWGSGPSAAASAYEYAYWKERVRSFEAVATYRSFAAEVGPERTDVVRGLRVPSSFLEVVGYRPELGRGIAPEEDLPGGPAVVVLSHGVWQSRFGGDPGVLGRTMVLDGEPHTVVGVLPEAWAFPQAPDATDVLVPLRLVPDPADEGHNWSVIARLAPGVTRDRADEELTRIYSAFSREHPDLAGENSRGLRMVSFQALHVGGLGRALWILMGAIALVLLIACANVANLLLARSARRRRELAVRRALGASRGRITRQVLTESVVLAALAGALGLLLGAWATRALLALSPERLPRMDGIGLDGAVVGFTALAALATGVVFGLIAAWPSGRDELVAALKHAAPSGGRGFLRRSLVAAEAAVSMVLLVGAGLLIATLLRLNAVDPGFDPGGVLTAAFSRTPSAYSGPEALAELERQLLERLRADPSIQAVAAASNLPMERGWNIPVFVEGRPDAGEGAIEWRGVSPGYFETLEIPVVRGRSFRATDDARGRPVALVNEAFARRYFPDGDPIGQRLQIGWWRGQPIAPAFAGPGAEIVGVVADVREVSLRREAARTVFVPRAQAPAPLVGAPLILARTARPDAAAAAIRSGVARVAPGMPAPEVRALDDVIAASLSLERFSALLMGVFAALALVLTAVGIFGVVSYGVRQRRQEIGIRMALGASRGRVMGMVTREGMVPVVIGLVVGTGAALGLSRLLSSLVWGVTPTDPLTIAAVALCLAAVAALASWLPSLEATGVDPVESLKT